MSSEKYIGLDVHQATLSVAVMDSQGKVVMESILETKASTLLEFFAGLRGSLFVTFEEGTWAAWLYDLLKPHVAEVLVCNPRKIPLLKQGNKSDKIDARKLAERRITDSAVHVRRIIAMHIASIGIDLDKTMFHLLALGDVAGRLTATEELSSIISPARAQRLRTALCLSLFLRLPLNRGTSRTPGAPSADRPFPRTNNQADCEPQAASGRSPAAWRPPRSRVSYRHGLCR